MNNELTITVIPDGQYKNKPHISIFLLDPSYVAYLFNKVPTSKILDGFFKHMWDLDALPFVVQCEECEQTATHALGEADDPYLSFQCPHCAIATFKETQTCSRVMRSFMDVMNNFDGELIDVKKRRKYAFLLMLEAKGIDWHASLRALDFQLKNDDLLD